MALNLFNHHNFLHHQPVPLFGNVFGPGFDELFAPPLAFTRHLERTLFGDADPMPVIDKESKFFSNDVDWKLFKSSPGYEIHETSDGSSYQIAVDIPNGVEAKDMTVQLENEGRVLHISGARRVEIEQEPTATKENKEDSSSSSTTNQDDSGASNGGRRSVSETRFEKRFTIGDNVDTSKLSANFHNGVLVLTAPKLEKKKQPSVIIPITEGPEEQARLLRHSGGTGGTEII